MGIKTHVKPPAKTWHVLVSGGFQILGVMFQGARFSIRWNQRQATTKTWHIFVLVCLRACTAHVGKLASRHLEANNTFTTCHWKNVEGVKGLPIYSYGLGKGGFFFEVVFGVQSGLSTIHLIVDTILSMQAFFFPLGGGPSKSKEFSSS